MALIPSQCPAAWKVPPYPVGPAPAVRSSAFPVPLGGIDMTKDSVPAPNSNNPKEMEKKGRVFPLNPPRSPEGPEAMGGDTNPWPRNHGHCCVGPLA